MTGRQVRLREAIGGLLLATYKEFGVPSAFQPHVMPMLVDDLDRRYGRHWDGVFPQMALPLFICEKSNVDKKRDGLIVAWPNVLLLAHEIRWALYKCDVFDTEVTRTTRATMATAEGNEPALKLAHPSGLAIIVAPQLPRTSPDQRAAVLHSLETVLTSGQQQYAGGEP